jgi:hypothetical protein
MLAPNARAWRCYVFGEATCDDALLTVGTLKRRWYVWVGSIPTPLSRAGVEIERSQDRMRNNQEHMNTRGK